MGVMKPEQGLWAKEPMETDQVYKDYFLTGFHWIYFDWVIGWVFFGIFLLQEVYF